MITVKKRYVEIEIPDESEHINKLEQSSESEHINKSENINKLEQSKSENIILEKDLQIPLEKLKKNPSEILIDVTLRLGKMRIQDIAYDLNINIPTVKKYRKEIFGKLNEIQKIIIISQEQKIEELRQKILAGEMKKRPRNYSFGIEGLVRGIIRDLTRQGKSIREIREQTNLDTSTISYHREKIKNGERRKYPPRIMNMTPNKNVEVTYCEYNCQ